MRRSIRKVVSPRLTGSMLRVFVILFVLLTIVLAVATALPISDFRYWWVRILDFPRLQIATLLVLLLLIYLAWYLWGNAPSLVWPAILLICAIYQLYWIIPYTIFHPIEIPALQKERLPQHTRLRILSSNVLMSNRNSSSLLSHIEREDPHLILTLETDQWWQEQLDSLSEYPHRMAQPLDNKYGMHIYSKLALHDTAIEYLVEDDIPSMVAIVELPDGARVRLHALHPTPPVPGENDRSTERDVELLIIANRLESNDDMTVVIGDLNDVAWSKTTQLFRNISGLLDPRVGRGMFNSFHADYWFARWPLDHVFTSEHFRLVDLQRLSSIGSDHFPVLVDLAVGDPISLNSHPDDKEIDEELEQETLNTAVGSKAAIEK